MKTFLAQLAFDGKRLVVRNVSFIFFSIIMPTGFYLLFTKIMASGSAAEIKQFNLTYMGQMIVYSVLIEAFFSIASILRRDREKGLTTFLRLSSTWHLTLLHVHHLLDVDDEFAVSCGARRDCSWG